MTSEMVEAACSQISEGLGAYLRKFADSDAAKRARHYLHEMPKSEWAGMIHMLAEHAVHAALAARPTEAGSVKIQRYELTPHGTLKEAADGWWTSADAAEALAERLAKALRDIDAETNGVSRANMEAIRRIARAALQQEGENDV